MTESTSLTSLLPLHVDFPPDFPTPRMSKVKAEWPHHQETFLSDIFHILYSTLGLECSKSMTFYVYMKEKFLGYTLYYAA